MNKSPKFSPEVRERAVRMVQEHRADYLRIFGRAGLSIPRSTLAQWVGTCGVRLQPLVDALKAQMLKHRVLHADETPVQMLKPAGKRDGKTHRAYLWAYAPGAFETTCAVVYEYEGTSHFRATASECQDWRVGSQSQPLWKGKSHAQRCTSRGRFGQELDPGPRG